MCFLFDEMASLPTICLDSCLNLNEVHVRWLDVAIHRSLILRSTTKITSQNTILYFTKQRAFCHAKFNDFLGSSILSCIAIDYLKLIQLPSLFCMALS